MRVRGSSRRLGGGSEDAEESANWANFWDEVQGPPVLQNFDTSPTLDSEPFHGGYDARQAHELARQRVRDTASARRHSGGGDSGKWTLAPIATVAIALTVCIVSSVT